MRAINVGTSVCSGQLYLQEVKMIFLHLIAGHLLYLMCSSYSWRKYRNVVITGLGAVLPRAHKEPSMMAWDNSSNSSMSPSLPFPSVILVKISSMRELPSRQRVHLPQDSFLVKLKK